MKRRMLPAVVVLAGLPAWAQGQGTAPVAAPVGTQVAAPASADPSSAVPPSTDVDPGAGKVFRSRSAGVEITPPDGGLLVRRPNDGNGGEIAEFRYERRAWEIFVKVIPNGTARPLLTDPAKPLESGLLDIAVAQLTSVANESTTVSVHEAVTIGAAKVGLIEAHRGSGIGRHFIQEAIFPDADPTRYVLIQMISPERPAGDAGAGGDAPEEAQARRVFRSTLGTVRLPGVAEVKAEAVRRAKASVAFLDGLTEPQVRAALADVRFIRVVRNGQNVGFVQVNARAKVQDKQDGFEVVVQSHVVQPATAAADDGPGGVVPAVPGSVFDAQTTYFCTFDRWHEQWHTTARLTPVPAANAGAANAGVANAGVAAAGDVARPAAVPVVTPALTPVVTEEFGNSDKQRHIARDVVAQQNQARQPNPAGKPANNNPPVIERIEYRLTTSRYAGAKGAGKPRRVGLGPIYLPQAVGQVLPELLPTAPGEYLFQWYVPEQGDTLSRYVDVRPAADVMLDGQKVNAVTIEDRIGVDSPPTTHYVGKDGQWLGDAVDDGNVLYLPATEAELRAIWPGFHVYDDDPEARLAEQARQAADRGRAANAGRDAAGRDAGRGVARPTGPDVPGLETVPVNPNGGRGR